MYAEESLIFSRLIFTSEKSVRTTLCDKIHTGDKLLLIISTFFICACWGESNL